MVNAYRSFVFLTKGCSTAIVIYPSECVHESTKWSNRIAIWTYLCIELIRKMCSVSSRMSLGLGQGYIYFTFTEGTEFLYFAYLAVILLEWRNKAFITKWKKILLSLHCCALSRLHGSRWNAALPRRPRLIIMLSRVETIVLAICGTALNETLRTSLPHGYCIVTSSRKKKIIYTIPQSSASYQAFIIFACSRISS